ncbi:MAG: hypothetical protein A2X18_00095 [Bacteroidetes bacterium GWF2_40_14]|nr:MAG: hypothetical protein A2X18_00095 [Bacteroidetes bacterium GWF2_40_14]
MKNKILFLSLYLITLVYTNICKAQSGVSERLYISTDRGAYIAGEVMWLSVYCFDISKSKDMLSDLSNVAYIEIHNSNGVVMTSKIALTGGRGSGRITFPPNLPTGNYRLTGYTKQMLNEEKVEYFEKIFSLYNTLTSERVPGNVTIGEDDAKKSPALDQSLKNDISQNEKFISLEIGEKGKEITKNSSFKLALKNITKERMTLNISVVRSDSIPEPDSPLLMEYLPDVRKSSVGARFTGKYTPEYEGEIIKGRIFYEGSDLITEKIAFLSAANGESDIYTSSIDSSGNIVFYTNSIYGDRNIVVEVPKTDSNSKMSFEIFDPFVKTTNKPVPSLILGSRIEKSLNERSIEMQIGRRFGADTLFERISVKRDPLLSIKPVVYKLDDYTRFTLMQEVVVEYVSELRFRKVDERTDLQVRWVDGYNSMTYSRDNTLVLIDGIAVFDHKRVMDYDPLKVKSISIYGSKFFIGLASYAGIVSIKTYKGNFPGLTFNKNVRIVDYQGVQYPCRFTGKDIVSASNIPDLRSLLLWEPHIDLSSSDKTDLTVYTPSYPGKFIVKLEGITSNGTPFNYSKVINVNN